MTKPPNVFHSKEAALIRCDCGTPEHFIELRKDADDLLWYSITSQDNGLMDRLRSAWFYLFKGRSYHSMVLRTDEVVALLEWATPTIQGPEATL